MGEPAFDILSLQSALDEAIRRAEEAEARAAAAEARATAAEARALRADTHVALAEARARKLITTARRYRAVVASIPDTFVAVFDDELRYQVVEGRVPDGLDPERMVGCRPTELFGEPFGEVIEHRIRGTLEGRQTEQEVRLDDGRVYVIHFRPLRDEHGAITGGMGLWQEVTRLKQAEDALRRKSEDLQRALDQREVLLREVYHRVKNNLQVVSSLLSLQSRTLADPAARAALQGSRQRVAAMSRVHEQLYRNRDLARIDLGHYVDQLTGELVATYRQDPTIDVRVDVEEARVDVEVAISAGLVLHELVANALQHAWPDGGPGTLSVRLRDGERIRLEVIDDGIGAPAEPSRGTLGTRLVRSLADQLGSEVQRLEGPGTGWRLDFPAGGSG